MNNKPQQYRIEIITQKPRNEVGEKGVKIIWIQCLPIVLQLVVKNEYLKPINKVEIKVEI